MDQLAAAVDALTTAVEGLQAENAALKTKADRADELEQALADAAGKVAALTEEISSPPAP